VYKRQRKAPFVGHDDGRRYRPHDDASRRRTRTSYR